MANTMMNKGKKPQLLAPAGDFEKFLLAVAYGADAVYLGGEEFGLRAASANFTLEEIAAAVDIAKGQGISVYVAVNIFAHNADIAVLIPYLKALNAIGPQGIIVSDLGVFALARQYARGIPIHVSTQANTTNYAAVAQWQKLGASRVVLARELTLSEIEEIAAKTSCELEVFIHGALCMSYSGRCLLSNFLTHRDANRGACTHPCRWQYALVEAARPGEYLPIEEDMRGSYIMNSKDLNLLSYLPQLYRSGVNSFKIEGRVKSSYYVAVVTKVYREAIDTLCDDSEAFARQLPFWQRELATVSHREYTQGFLKGEMGTEDYGYESSGYVRQYDFVALVKDYDARRKCLILEQRNNFKVGDTLEIVSPCRQGEGESIVIDKLYDADFKAIDVAPHAQMKVYMPWPHSLTKFSILRRKRL